MRVMVAERTFLCGVCVWRYLEKVLLVPIGDLLVRSCESVLLVF